MDLTTLPALAPYAARYAELVGIPLRVVCTLHDATQVVGYDPPHLDGLLCRLVVEAAGLHTLADGPVYDLPAPLRVWWRSPDGLPLYAATPFRPVGAHAADVVMIHKRAPSGRWSGTTRPTFTVRTGAGRWMERRVPLPATTARTWVADCIGDPDAIASLLAGCTHLGKKREMGHGAVATWRVEPVDAVSIVRDGHLTRALPAPALSDLAVPTPTTDPTLVGWTPPHWRAPLWLPGWPAGAAVP